jgi:hypothetical protein
MAEHVAYKDRDWSRQPTAEAVLQDILEEVLGRCPGARSYSQALLDKAGVRMRDLLDHLEFASTDVRARIEAAGWRPDDDNVWRNESGLFPAFLEGPGLQVAFRVESLDNFLISNGLDLKAEGQRFGPLRKARVFGDDRLGAVAVERNGHVGFDVPRVTQAQIRAARLHHNAFRARRRQFDTVPQGLAHTEALVDAAVDDLGPHWACHLWLSAEREFWMQRCGPGRLQKARQDALGIGWANIDHHTYDSSRRHYRHTIRILEKLGYELREMLYAGELAGWGSQVLEQPALKSTIFADVDLAPNELEVDFAHEELPDLPKHRRAGVLCVLHGESILEAGLNHVAGLFDQSRLRTQLDRHGVKMMSPFSAFEHLYQELTEGEYVAVDPQRVDLLEAEGHLSAEEAEKIRMEGAIISHLENIERNDGFKGFNKPGIDGVLRKLDPRAAAAMTAE